MDPADPPAEARSFLTERHLATLTVLAPDGSPRVTPIGVTFEAERQLARVITWEGSWKVRHLRAGHDDRVAICSVDGGRWLTMYGRASVTAEPDAIAEGVRRYAQRYRTPGEREDRVVIEVSVERMIGRV